MTGRGRSRAPARST